MSTRQLLIGWRCDDVLFTHENHRRATFHVMTFRPESLLAPVTIQTWDQHDQIRMDFKDQANSTSWISLINTVFASIAVLPVFLVWFLGIITDSIEEKENHGDRVIILDENDTEELQEPEGEERHLYVIPMVMQLCLKSNNVNVHWTYMIRI